MGDSMTRYGLHSVPAPKQTGSKRVASSAATPSVRPPRHHPDRALLAALREGHIEFLRYAIRRTRSITEGEGLVGEFYREAFGNTPAIKEGQGLKGWLIAALRTALAGHKRAASAKGPAQFERPDVDEPLPMFLDDMERAVSGCLYRILPTLARDSSWLIWQADLLGQPLDRLAGKLGISIDNLKLRLARARRTMRAVLERYRMTCPSHGFLNCTCEQSLEIASDLVRLSLPDTPAPARD
jgi:DNA-directed RNA polymerase specialized sigma24 family protein